MKLSARLEILPGEGVLAKVQNAQRFGFEGIGLSGRFLAQSLPEIEAVKSDLPIGLMSLSLGFAGSLLHPDEAERRACRESLRGLMDMGARLGVKRLNVPPVLNQDNPFRIQNRGQFSSIEARLDAMLLDQLGALGDEAKAHEMLFLIEPVNRFESDYLHSIEHGARLCQALGHDFVKMTIDTFHMQMEELIPQKAIVKSAQSIAHVHVAENTRVEPGSGSLDFASIFQGLRAIGYDDWIELECRALSGNAEKVLPASAQYLRSLWKNHH